MTRPLLPANRIHPAIEPRVAEYGAAVIAEVEAAIAAHAVVVVGMRMNPFPRKARKLLDAAGVPYKYLEYGSYLSGWRTRLPLKMWTGWPTLPMVFVDGRLVGGAADLAKLDLPALKNRAPGGAPRQA